MSVSSPAAPGLTVPIHGSEEHRDLLQTHNFPVKHLIFRASTLEYPFHPISLPKLKLSPLLTELQLDCLAGKQTCLQNLVEVFWSSMF